MKRASLEQSKHSTEAEWEVLVDHPDEGMPILTRVMGDDEDGGVLWLYQGGDLISIPLDAVGRFILAMLEYTDTGVRDAN